VLTSKAPYSCVLGSREHRVETKRGRICIGALKVGDEVMTQSGRFEEIEAINSFPAIEKPDYVEIVAEYRKDYHHTIKLSLDHKVMSVNEDGCTFWIEAGKLKVGNFIFKLRKQGPNKGIFLSKTVNLICKQCHKNYKIRKRDYEMKKRYIFCSQKCYDLSKGGEGNPNYGNKYSEELKQRLSEIHKKRFKDNPEKHPNRILAKKGYKTSIEKEVEGFIKRLGFEYEFQYSIGRLFVDFFIPELNLIIECDGAYWHQDQEKDIKRDKKLLKLNPKLRIIHFHFVNKRFSKQINSNPLENVYYLQCDPSTKSFIDLNKFKKAKIISVKRKQYKMTNEHPYMKYYDIQVKNFHSFVCNSLLISNSDLEFGNTPRDVSFSDIEEWASRKGIISGKKGGAFVKYVVEKIKTKGVNARPFLRPSLQQTRDFWLPQFKKEVFGE